MNRIPHWIGGSPTTGRSERTSPVYDPATGQQSAEVVLASRADVDHAVATAATAFETWSQSALSVRTKVMFAFRQLVVERMDDLAAVVSGEYGKVLSDAR